MSVPKLTGDNYHAWKFAISMVLRRTGVWNIMLDKLDEVKPEEERLKRSQAKDDTRTQKLEEALTTIGLTVDSSQYQYIQECTNGAEAWKALADIYEKNSRANRIALKRQFYGFNHDAEAPICTYISGIMSLAGRLKAIGVKLEDIDIVDVLIFNLDESWSSIAASLCTAGDDINSLSVVTNALIDEEGRRGGPPSFDSATGDTAMLARRTRGRIPWSEEGKKGRNQVTCYNCGKPGHISRDCQIGQTQRRNDRDRDDNRNEEHASQVCYELSDDCAY